MASTKINRLIEVLVALSSFNWRAHLQQFARIDYRGDVNGRNITHMRFKILNNKGVFDGEF